MNALVGPFEGQFDAVAGVEARGFLLAAAAAYAAAAKAQGATFAEAVKLLAAAYDVP